jgi:hypothetical protein
MLILYWHTYFKIMYSINIIKDFIEKASKTSSIQFIYWIISKLLVNTPNKKCKFPFYYFLSIDLMSSYLKD